MDDLHERLVIIGASGHGKVVADIAKKTGRYQSIIFLDDDDSLKESVGIQVAGKSMDMLSYVSSSDIFVAVGNTDIRKNLLEQLFAAGAHIPSLIHMNAVVGENVVIESGTAVMAGTVINPDVVIGKGCIINTGSSVDHDCMIEDYVHIAVGACLAGNVKVGKKTWIGAGAVLKNNINICTGCVIGAGAVVVKTINTAGVYAGVPAKELSKVNIQKTGNESASKEQIIYA